MSSTLLVLKRLIALNGYGYAYGNPSTAGSTAADTIVDTSGDSPLQPEDADTLFENAWVEIEDDSDGTTNEGEIRRVKAYAPGTATLTLSRAFTSQTATDMRYGIYFGLPPEDFGTLKGIKSYVNEWLRNHHYRHWSLLTLVTDGDMETSGVANWTASNATLAKVTTAASVDKGKQAMSVTATSDAGYAESAAVAVTGGRTIPLLADVKVTSGSATLELWDKTNDATIDSVTTSDTQATLLYLQPTIPSTCKSVAVRLVGVTSGNVATWDNVSLRFPAGVEMSVPSWLTEVEQAEAVWYSVDRGYSNATETRVREQRDYARAYSFDLIEDYGGATPFRVRFSNDVRVDGHAFLVGLRPFGELSSDSDTTDADKDWLAAGVLALIYEDKKDEEEAAKKAAKERELSKEPRWQGKVYKPVRW